VLRIDDTGLNDDLSMYAFAALVARSGPDSEPTLTGPRRIAVARKTIPATPKDSAGRYPDIE